MPKRLLVIDPIPTHRIRLKAALRAAQYDIISIDRIACAPGVMVSGPVDLILLNTSGVDPAMMMTRLRRTIGTVNVPVLCRDDDAGPVRRMAVLSTGARDMVATRVPETLLLARIRGLLRESETRTELERRRVAAASFGFSETSADFRNRGRVLFAALGKSIDIPVSDADFSRIGGYSVSKSSYSDLLRGDATEQEPDAIVLWVSNEGAALMDEVLPEIRMRSHLRQATVLVLYEDGIHDIAVRALNLGAAEIAEKGSTIAELTHRVNSMLARKHMRDSLRRSTEESYRLATTDPLTGLYNRRYAEVYLADVLLRARDSGRGFTVMMVDIDHFKAVNDTHGHAVGDDVLCEVAARIRDNLRAVDLVSRHGGEEFLVILPDIEDGEAAVAAERLRLAVGSQPVELPSGEHLWVSVSIGVSIASASGVTAARFAKPRQAEDPQREETSNRLITQLVSNADGALYSAKASGRNCVAVSPVIASAA